MLDSAVRKMSIRRIFGSIKPKACGIYVKLDTRVHISMGGSKPRIKQATNVRVNISAMLRLILEKIAVGKGNFVNIWCAYLQ